MKDATHIMIDIESLSNHPWNGVILEIGACKFSLDPLHPDPEILAEVGEHRKDYYFRVKINLADSLAKGLEIEADTLKWWLDKDRRDAFMEYLEDGRTTWTYIFALKELRWWLVNASSMDKNNLFVWSHGMNYDLAIIGNHFRRSGLPLPWKWKNERDTRTFFQVYKDRFGSMPQWVENPHLHNALSDACAQAIIVRRAYNALMDLSVAK